MAQQYWLQGDDDDEEGDQDDFVDMRHSMKRMFAAQAFGPLIGVCNNFEIPQFVYDLKLWTALCSKKQLNSGLLMRLMMRRHSFSPLYWKAVHCGLTDFVRQVGFPIIFWTMAPYVWSFLCHSWVRDEVQKELRHRLHLPVAEVAHITHVILEIVRGILVGFRTDALESVFNAHRSDGSRFQVHCVLRIQFQDGSKKRATQSNHGSGLPHCHVLFFFDAGALPHFFTWTNM